MFLNQPHDLVGMIGVDFVDFDFTRKLRLDRATFFQPATGQHDLRKYFRVLRALVHDHAADAARANNQYFTHSTDPILTRPVAHDARRET